MATALPFTLKLELVPLSVSDIDRAKQFYVEQVGFNLDHDVQPADGVRIVQLTPPGSGCSILLSSGMGDLSTMQPGTHKGLHLVVSDIAEARAALIARGLAIGEMVEFDRGIKYAGFSDPDGNTWTLQEIPPGI